MSAAAFGGYDEDELATARLDIDFHWQPGYQSREPVHQPILWGSEIRIWG